MITRILKATRIESPKVDLPWSIINYLQLTMLTILKFVNFLRIKVLNANSR